jgi:hypothetical protein
MAGFKFLQKEADMRMEAVSRVQTWRSQMAVSSEPPRPHAENLGDVETLRILVVFGGIGLVLSLFLAANGWI